jgi:hypothetical protein
LIFLAADYDSVSRLKDQVRSTLAWQSIVGDIKEMKLNLDQFQSRQASKSLEDANEALRRMIRETYKWIVAPMQEARRARGCPRFSGSISRQSGRAEPVAGDRARAEGKRTADYRVGTDPLGDSAQDVVLERGHQGDRCAQRLAAEVPAAVFAPLRDDTPFQHTLAAGAESRDFLRLRARQGRWSLRRLQLRQAHIIIPRLVAAADRASHCGWIRRDATYGRRGCTPEASRPCALDAIQAKKQFADLVDEVILQFTSRPGVKVKIAIEIQAETSSGFDDSLQRAVKENCNVLRFKNAEFEEAICGERRPTRRDARGPSSIPAINKSVARPRRSPSRPAMPSHNTSMPSSDHGRSLSNSGSR